MSAAAGAGGLLERSVLPELEARVAELARALLATAREPLAVGVQLALDHGPSTCVAEPAEAAGLGRSFDACVWLLVGTSPRWGLSVLRPLLRPAARLLLAAPLRAPALAQLRALLGGARPPAPPSLESVCDALLLQGFCAPRVHAQLPAWRLVSAELPNAPSELDIFFEQPPRPAHR